MKLTRNFSLVNGACLTAVAASIFVLTACGGGGGSSTTSSTAKTVSYQRAYASGRVAGFGSVIINGVHYDETTANVVDDDGVAHASTDLKLGMMAEVQASDFGQTNSVTTATAQSITVKSLMRGPVESSTADSLVIFGQTVKVTATTVFDTSLVGGLAAVKTGDVVKIYGTLDTVSGVYTATRIEPKSGAELFSLRGSVTSYDAISKTLAIGPTLIDVSAVVLPDGITAGSLVRVKLQVSPVMGKWVAVSVKSGLSTPHDNDHSEVEGTITDFTSASAFSVDGLPVDASKAVFPDGSVNLVKGTRVEVEGAVVSGVLVATKVEIKTDKDEQDQGFDIEGAITALDTLKSTLVVHGVTVNFTGTVTLVGGVIADLIVGAKVEVLGALAADGTAVNATQIKFKH